jgi:hypothetical protein
MKRSISQTKILLLAAAFFLFMCLWTFNISRVKAQDYSTETNVRVQASASPLMRPSIKVQMENRLEQNRDTRNTMIDSRQDILIERREDLKLLRGSTTDMFRKRLEIRQEIAKKMQRGQFEIRKNALVRELTVALTNLQNISIRIEARISSAESRGRTMTEAKELLVVANSKLAQARVDVAAFQALTIEDASASASASTTVEVDITKPRTLGDAAIKSVKEARDAFRKVVVSIAHAMGLGNDTATSSDRINN